MQQQFFDVLKHEFMQSLIAGKVSLMIQKQTSKTQAGKKRG